MNNVPLACALSADELRCAANDLLPGLAREARTVSRGLDDARLEFELRPGLIEHIAAVIERERRCCPFFGFRVAVPAGAGSITLDITGPPGTGDFLAGLSVEFQHPSER